MSRVSRSSAENEQGLSIWAFIAIFVALAIVGLLAVVVVGTPSDDSRSTRTAFIASPGTDDAAASAGGAGTGTDADDDGSTQGAGAGSPIIESTPSTLPGGLVAPENATRLVSTGDALTLGFRVDEASLGPKPLAMVPPVEVVAGVDGMTLAISVGCARASSEQLAQLSLTETSVSVTVSAVKLVPADAGPCDPLQPPKTFELPLKSPLERRSIMVVPTSTALPEIDLEHLSGN